MDKQDGQSSQAGIMVNVGMVLYGQPLVYTIRLMMRNKL